MTIRTISVREARRLGAVDPTAGDVFVGGSMLPGAPLGPSDVLVVLDDPEDLRELQRALHGEGSPRLASWGTP